MKKRAQTTFFMLLGIYMLVVIALFLSAVKETTKSGLAADEIETVQLNFELIPINNFFESCVKDIAEEAIVLAGFQGGFVEHIPGIPKLETSFADIQFWKFHEAKLYSQSLKNVAANQISEYVGNRVQSCALSTKEKFPAAGFGDRSVVNTLINRDDVAINMNFDVKIGTGDKLVKNGMHRIKIPVRLGYIMDSAEKIIDRQIKDIDKIDLTYLSGFDFEVSSIMSDDEEVLFKIVDKKSSIDNEPYIFLFAEKYSLETNGIDYHPRLDFINDIKAKVGEKYSKKVSARDVNNDIARFTSSSDIFQIAENGLIDFTPTAESIGLHFATITVEDSKGFKDTQVVKIEVV